MKKIFTLLFILFSAAAFGQEKVATELNLNYSSLHYNDTLSRVRLINFKISALIHRSDDNRLSASFNYNNETFSNFPGDYGNNLQGLALGLNWYKATGAGKGFDIFAQAGVYSDMEYLSTNTIRERLGFTYLTKTSDRFTLGFGLAYARQFYGNQIIPIVLVRYRFDNEHWKISGTFPEDPKLTYGITKNSAFSLELKDGFSSYRLSAPKDSGNFIKISKLATLVNYEYTFAKSWRIIAGLGYALRQKYELYKDDNTDQWYFIGSKLGYKATPLESVDHNGAQFQVGIAFNPSF